MTLLDEALTLAPGLEAVRSPVRRDFSIAQLKLIRRSVCRHCEEAEFDEFVAVAGQCGLDPLRRQIAPLIVHANDPARRRLIPWATIDGLRLIAARQGDYRPMERPPKIDQDVAVKDADRNPLGLIRAEVCAWKFRDGAWFEVAGEAWWDEFAPLKPAKDEPSDAPTIEGANPVLDPTWRRMGRTMLAKCAEAQALRRGWPDVISGLYGEEELHALRSIEFTASERLSIARRIPKNLANPPSGEIWLTLDPREGLQSIRLEEVLEKSKAYLERVRTQKSVQHFLHANRLSFAGFWEAAPADAFALKKIAEDRLVALGSSKAANPAAPRQRGRSARTRKKELSAPNNLAGGDK